MSIDIARLVKEASEAAKHAPEHLQEAAFNRAFELLAGGPAAAGTTGRKHANHRTIGETTPDGGGHRENLDGLDRTAHPEINHGGSALLNALGLLRAAKEDLNVDGLSAAAISQTLVDKFRCRITRQAISMALNRAGRYVNRHKEGGAVIFRIMAPGEEYLRSTAQSASTATSGAKKSGARGRSPHVKKGASDRQAKHRTKDEREGGGRQSSTKGSGAWAATTRLVSEGFFRERRVIGAIVAHMKENEGRRYKANEISPALLRLLRDKKLVRAKNKDGQYEYWQN
jgi:hypothetical protein